MSARQCALSRSVRVIGVSLASIGIVVPGFLPSGLASSVLPATRAAHATTGTGTGSTTTTTSGGSGGSTIWAGVSYYVGSWTGTHSNCTWLAYEAFDPVNPGVSYGYVYKVVGGVTYQLFTRYCSGVATDVWIPQLPPSQLGSSGAAYLARILPRPTPSFAPAADRMIVTIDSWFWIAAAAWVPKSVTAWVPTPWGVLWSTTYARPSSLEFDPGDSSWGTGAVTCTGPGTPWAVNLGATTPSPSGCDYTYRHSSVRGPDGATFPSVTTIVWNASWSSSTGAGGVISPIRTWTGVPVTVREIQAVGMS